MNKTYYDKERFLVDYAIGLIGENRFKDYITSCSGYFIYNLDMENKIQPDFDSITYNLIEKELVRWEIKTDRAKTPNIAVQVHSSSKKDTAMRIPGFDCSLNAGVFRTLSDKFATYHVNSDTFYIADTVKLQSYILNTPRLKSILANKYKSEQTGVVLIPMSEWSNIGEIVRLSDI
ncbi:hypothetical protein [Deinococcus ruber]|uniref:Uncharacterized protein n=1 Tax=Deinococcus ruber TaxID=1848197 RepID=A0A918FIX2_9DEIO|nr:hypothetical protein [Deinococcus ruber]GGR40862.1 hypothetical protein GCM10008957_56410 [Deinococcus ruber]